MPAHDHPTGHDLIAIEAWLPGPMPTAASLTFPEQTEYHTRFWRCRACGAERNRTEEFEVVCPGFSPTAVVTDGGSSTEDDHAERAYATDLTVEFLTFGPGYRVIDADGTSYVVDIEARICSCLDSSADCEHLRRADDAILTRELPGPDGVYVP